MEQCGAEFLFGSHAAEIQVTALEAAQVGMLLLACDGPSWPRPGDEANG